MNVIATIPPYAPFIEDVVRHPITSGIRLNTVMPIVDSLEEVVGRLAEQADSHGKELWVDLKGRQLRIKTHGVPPFTDIELSHEIEVDTPVNAYFSDGEERAKVLKVDGNRLIMQEGPKRVVGPGESINIPSDSLVIHGGLTDTDVNYINACKSVGVHNYMLSFVESQNDLDELFSHDDKANIYAKIESKKGLDFVGTAYKGDCNLMAARGDLFIELDFPHQVTQACEYISKADPNAMVGSRILSNLKYSLSPSCADLNDVDNLRRMGYETLMLGDEICMHQDSIISALNILKSMEGIK